MQLKLRCTSVIPHADKTVTVTLAVDRGRVAGVAAMTFHTPAAGPQLRIEPAPVSLPAPLNPVQMLLTNISAERHFELGKEYAVDISPA